jgi:hypothetical protein
MLIALDVSDQTLIDEERKCRGLENPEQRFLNLNSLTRGTAAAIFR